MLLKKERKKKTLAQLKDATNPMKNTLENEEAKVEQVLDRLKEATNGKNEVCRDEETRSWVDSGFSTTGIHLLESSYEDVLHILNDMADFDYRWHWDPSQQGRSHQYPLNFKDEEKKKNQIADLIAALTKSHMEFMNETCKSFRSNRRQ
ncbi:uncharacterized protein LOC119370268 [Jatropha curcas]|uniref:uncharacterized protein LOC119370268 n=1 Tax=Jatropha curcas TaxID=180498 RepID=UPI001893BA41|nr:uncharacterized protein LOC119370268 [Jatropha curcas]